MPIIKYRLKFGQGSPNLTNKGMSIGGIQPNFLETPHPNKKKIPTIQCFNWPTLKLPEQENKIWGTRLVK